MSFNETNKSVFSTFVNGDLRADVIKLDSHWGCRLYCDGKLLKTEFYRGHNELYAEDAAENYVMGIKKI